VCWGMAALHASRAPASATLVGMRRERSVRTIEAFTALYEEEYQPLLRIAYGLTGSVAEAEELVQETFVRCYQRWAKVQRYERPGAWLRRVLLNLATSRGRRLAVELKALTRLGSRPAQRHSDPDEGLDTKQFWAAVRRLPRRQAQAVVLYYGDDLATDEVARVMTVAEGTVRALLHQARTALATVLDSEEQA
jgi:RNA polymerase sigma-70 factor, ECF subfamily